jgi:hypothetical protein
MLAQNTGKLLPDYMASHPRRCSMASEVRTELLNPIPTNNFKL